jgi:BirA family biotin operon repressor/biotin-[acetyl-CoA-carboxylase] ligase
MDAERDPYESVRAGREAGIIGKKIIYFPSLPSTMDTAQREVQRGAAEGTVIIAGEQTRGRGRLQRTWVSPAGNIALSIILYPGAASLPYLVMIASLAVAYSIEVVTGLKTQIKWPNDVLIGGRKVGGILIENEVRGNRVACAIVGIGINVELKTSNVTEIATTATSLKDELGGEVSGVDIVRHLLMEFERLYLTLPAGGGAILKAWRDKLATLGKKVVVKSGSSILEGIAESVDESGALILRLDDGSSTRIVAGDVTLRDKK